MMQHNRRKTELGVFQQSKHSVTAVSGSPMVAKYRLWVARRRVEPHRIPDLGRHPHARPCSVLLEMAFVHAPQFNVLASGYPAQFF